MSKRKWYTKAIYLGVALAMTLGLLMVPAAGADATETEVCGCLMQPDADGTATWDNTGGNVHSEDVTVMGDYSVKLDDSGANSGDLHVQFTPAPGTTLSDLEALTNEWGLWFYPVSGGLLDSPQLELKFTSGTYFVDITVMPAVEGTVGTWKEVVLTSDLMSVGYWSNSPALNEPGGNVTLADALTALQALDAVAGLNVMGWELTTVQVELYTAEADKACYTDDITIDGVTYDLEPCYYLVPADDDADNVPDDLSRNIAYDVKGNDTEDTWQRFVVVDACGNYPPVGCVVCGWDITPGLNMNTVGVPGSGSDIIVEAGGTPGIGGDTSGCEDYIKISATQPGDCHIYAYVDYDEGGCGCGDTVCGSDVWDVKLDAEKKWGEIAETVLDLDVEDPETIADPDTSVSHAAGDNTTAETEVFSDYVKAEFLMSGGTFIERAGHAIVHWWLIEDDVLGVNEAAINAIMATLGPDGCGPYAEELAASAWEPKKAIDAVWTGDEAAYTDLNVDTNYVKADTYAVTETEVHWPGRVIGGRAMVTSENVGPESILVVTLTEYPHNYHGENPVCVEKGKKTWYPPGVPPIPEQIKAPQVRWAGEKIVLEKQWGEENEIVVFALQEGSVGSLEAIYTDDITNSTAQTVITTVQSDDMARCILQSQPQGQADVKAALYAGHTRGQLGGDSFPEAMGALDGTVVTQNHDFLVYFLALEDVSVDEELSNLTAIDAGASANVTVKVRGWFTRDDLQSDRPARDVDGDGLYELPAGRIVLPDDWAALAGSVLATSNKASRPQYDLMNTPGAGVDSSAELGPYDSAVRTTTIPGEAEAPCIGPFNALQPWSNFDAVTLDPTNMWIATDSVVADSTVSTVNPDAMDLRNTVVPDTTIDWYDCPMPQALVTFDVDDTEVLSALDKGDVFFSGTGAAKVYTAPFYAVEIPSHWLIPVAGYFWDSWGLTGNIAIDGPYNYWDDLGVTPSATDDDILEVYSDNHGYAGVTIVGTGLANECVTLDVIADFPVMAAKYIAVDTTREVCWGIAVEHLNADFEVSDRTGEATTADPLTISFYGLKAAGTGVPWTTGGTQPYVKAEWDFDGDGFIDETVIGTGTTDDEITDSTLVTQTFEFTTAGNYSPWLRVTDDNGLVDICEKPNYIVLTGEELPAFPLCDIDESGTVDIEDFVVFAASYGSNPGDANWDARCDLNEVDGVDILDFIIFAQCYVAEA